MYLFVFIWVPALQECSITPTSIPLGYVFSAFMISMMLGSLFYTFITLHWHRPPPPHLQHTRSVSVSSTLSTASSAATPDSTLTLHAKLSSLVCAVSALAFAASVSAGRTKGEGNAEMVKFWAFCLFEACVGIYYPVQGMLRGSLIANEHRATVRLTIVSVFSFLPQANCAFVWDVSCRRSSASHSTYLSSCLSLQVSRRRETSYLWRAQWYSLSRRLPQPSSSSLVWRLYRHRGEPLRHPFQTTTTLCHEAGGLGAWSQYRRLFDPLDRCWKDALLDQYKSRTFHL